MILDQRPMRILVDDDIEVAKDLRKWLRGKTVMSLLPDFYLLDVSGMSDADFALVKYAGKITVLGEKNTVLCVGKIKELYQYQNDMDEVTTISIADGMEFWNAIANQSVGKGATIRNTLITCLNGIPLGSYVAQDTQLLRGQAFLDRLPDVVSTLAKSVHARAYFTHGQVNIMSRGSTASVIEVKDRDILENPGFSNGVCTLKTKVKGYQVGLLATIEGKHKKYRLVSQAFNADSWQGDWISELMLIDEDIITDMEGG